MRDYLKELFSDEALKKMVREKLPYLFQLAEIDCSRAGKLGMEVGSVRERIIIALLIRKFGDQDVDTDLPITRAEVDVILFDKPISIKTISGDLGGVKLIWTVDPQKALQFRDEYKPDVDLLLVNIKWGDSSGFYYIPKGAQTKVFNKLGKKRYLKLPKQGTNPRGVEITKEAVEMLVKQNQSMVIDIDWVRQFIDYDVYDRWVELWRK